MRLIKLGHACVRIEHEGTTVVLDPGAFTDPGAAEGADVVLVTHEHADHWSAEQLRATDAPVVTIAAVRDAIAEAAPDVAERVRVVAPGEQLAVGVAMPLQVQVVGEQHAVIHPDLPRFDNSGYLLDVGGTAVFHPGDALTVPEAEVDLLLAPSSAPWLKASEAVDFVRAVGAPRNLSIHDRIYTEPAHAILAQHMERLIGEQQSYVRLGDGEEL